MRLEISGRAIVGSKEPQQDSWRVFNARGEDVSQKARSSAAVTGDGALVVVADGIGGYAGGEIASRLACDAFASVFFSQQGPVADRLSRALTAANAAIGEEKRRNPDLKEMGCTLVAVHFQQDRMTFVSVGDSLLLRSRDDEIHRVNVDHSYFEYLDRQVLGSGDPGRWAIAVGDARRRASLTLALTGGDLSSDEYGHSPQIAMRPLLADDIVVVASDGIETLDWVQLQNFLKHLRPTGVMGVADGLIGAVDGIGKNRSYQDNTTIVVVGASSGAGLTRVAMPAALATADGASVAGSAFATLQSLVSNTRLLFGAIIVSVALIIALLFRSGGNDVPPAPNPPPVTSDKSQPRKKQGEVVAPSGSRADTDQVREQQAAAPGPPAPSATSAPAATPAPSRETAGPSAVEPPSDREAVPVDPDAPKIEVRPRADMNDKRFSGDKNTVIPGIDSGECRRRCNDNPLCVAYTWRGDTQNNPCEIFTVVHRLDVAPKSQSGAREWDNYAWLEDSPTQSFMNQTRPSCFKECLNRASCGGYTYRPTEQDRCDLYPLTKGELSPLKGAFSGNLRPAVKQRGTSPVRD